jgi:hypothetical protein
MHICMHTHSELFAPFIIIVNQPKSSVCIESVEDTKNNAQYTYPRKCIIELRLKYCNKTRKRNSLLDIQ